jgi:hypothetical protein
LCNFYQKLSKLKCYFFKSFFPKKKFINFVIKSMKNDNLYQEEIEEESSDNEEEEEEEDDEDDIINFDEIDMSMNKSTISNVKANIHREEEIINNKDAIEKKLLMDSSRNEEKELGSNKPQNDNNLTNNFSNTNVNTVVNNQLTSKIEDKDSKNTSNLMNLASVSNVKELKNIDLSINELI